MTKAETASGDPGDDERRLCATCIGERFLKAVVRKEGEPASCDFCGRTRVRSITIAQLAERVDVAFSQHFERTSDQPDAIEQIDIMLGRREFVRAGEPVVDVISGEARIELAAAQAVADFLANRYANHKPGEPDEESEFDPDSHYRRRDAIADVHFHGAWERFERSLKSEVRFFSREAQTLLAGIFDGIEAVRARNGAAVVETVGPGTKLTALYRARVFQTDEELSTALRRPDLEIGPPPSAKARAGRMNARGVPVFYGATDEKIAMAEVRPPVGSSVVVARFEILRPLRLLDVQALDTVFVEGSVFDETLARRMGHALFLGTLKERITRAVMPDAEDFEYLVTQATADYLAEHPALDLDGIRFPSAQRRVGGANVVLFHKASRTKLFDLPRRTGIQVSPPTITDDDDEDVMPTWRVTEVMPSPDPPQSGASEDPLSSTVPSLAEVLFEEDADRREVSLRIARDSVVVHRVVGVSFKTEMNEVKRELINHVALDDL